MEQVVEQEKENYTVKKTVTEVSLEGLKYKVLSDESISLDHPKCYEHLELKRFDGERPVDERHLQFLYDEAMQGRFIWSHVTMATATLDGVKYGLNGQHTCWMRLNLPANYSKASIRYVNYSVPDEDNLRKLYGVFDVGKARSRGHILLSLLAGRSEMDSLSIGSLGQISAGLKLWVWESSDEARKHGPHELADMIRGKYNDVYRDVSLFYQRAGYPSHMKKAAVFAAMFATFDKVKSRAPEFWQPVADGLNLIAKTDPRHALRELLMRVHSKGKNHATGVRMMSSEDTYRHCIAAWNKWRKDEEVQALRGTSVRVKPV